MEIFFSNNKLPETQANPFCIIMKNFCLYKESKNNLKFHLEFKQGLKFERDVIYFKLKIIVIATAKKWFCKNIL